MKPTDHQPPPVANESPSLWDLVVADMEQRNQDGIQKHGTPLQIHNGRAALIDAYQEALDLSVYLRQEIEERNKKRDIVWTIKEITYLCEDAKDGLLEIRRVAEEFLLRSTRRPIDQGHAETGSGNGL